MSVLKYRAFYVVTLKRFNMKKLLDIMAALRDPETGCPWDIKQTFKTVVPYTLEEAYEVADAIENGDMNDINQSLVICFFRLCFMRRWLKNRVILILMM